MGGVAAPLAHMSSVATGSLQLRITMYILFPSAALREERKSERMSWVAVAVAVAGEGNKLLAEDADVLLLLL